LEIVADGTLGSGWEIERIPDWETAIEIWRNTGCALDWGTVVPGGNKFLLIPLYVPLFVLALPTAFLWGRDRRPEPGHRQKCGYDLTGNVSGRCPECGTPVPDTSAEGESA